jgi:anti-sigma regulatory factor (Ser/Thr protein kinase)
MRGVEVDKQVMRELALRLIAEDGHGVGSRLAREVGVSRQVANGVLQGLVRDGLVEAQGTTRARFYRLAVLGSVVETFPREGLEEHIVWQKMVLPQVAACPANVRELWNHAATEMINNAIDHSGSPVVRVEVRRTALWTEVLVADEGEGIFLKIQRALGLHDPREALLELAKGKLTTAPSHHSGEGIFFTSRGVDTFEIDSHQLRFTHDATRPDTIDQHEADTPGTRVRMRLANASTRRLRDVFDAFTDPEEQTFDKTIVPLRLAQFGGDLLVSRSLAKRVATRFERFRRVELDFSGIETIGQAFADELFRVFAAAHPDIRITPLNASTQVDAMIRRAVAARTAQDTTGTGD